MEGRFRSLLLSCITGASLFLSSVAVSAAELDENQELDSVIQPEIERKEFNESKIDSANFEFVGSVGLLSVEDFGANLVLNAKVVYHITEDFFTDLQLGRSTTGKTSFETLNPGGAPLLTDEERDLTYYLVSLGYNLLPGEAFITDKTTYNTALYLIAAIGSTEFAGESHFTVSYGFGYRFLASNHLSLYLDTRDHTFNIDILGENKVTHNLEMTFGASYYF
jgi:outer membrane beta-barrel protein